ncbi:MAG TPA: T9SS type A sorting domain-containing protein [Chitinophagaceae bacterium]|nr:T9SS type A sorting domain-containing protein [Chitinophagaceae bacterium]
MKKLTLLLTIVLINTTTNAQWSELGGTNSLSANNSISAICTDASGHVYAAGSFTQPLGYEYVAEFNGTTWNQLGAGYTNSLTATATIESICVDKSGNVYAAGLFKNGSGYYYVAQWNGTTWAELGGANALAANNEIFSLCTDTSGNVYAAGFFTNSSGNAYVAKWTRSNNTWSELGGNNSLAANANIACVYRDSLNNIYTAGHFTDGSGNRYVAKWDGTSWSEVGTGGNALAANNDILAITTDGGGNIYAAGGFTNGDNYSYVAKWDGASWTELGGTDALGARGEITSMSKDQYDNIYVGGLFKNASNYWYVASWNGTSWSELGGANSLAANLWIFAVTTDFLGNVYTGGRFTNGSGKWYVAKYGNIVAPVKFLSCNATVQTNNVLLQWQTAQEENSSYFNVQRSYDGKSFTTIAKVAAAGNSSSARNYSYTDESAGSLNTNTVFYRLAETDIDGSVTYSEVKAVNFTGKAVEFSVFPNPARDFVNIVASASLPDALLKVTDLNGRILYESNQSFVAGQQLQLSLSQFPKEVLLISIKNNGNLHQFKIINQ